MQLDTSQYFLFNAMADDMVKECGKMDEHIKDAGGIDMMVVGIGLNGHIGFNEPGTSFNSLCHVAELDETTKTVGQKYFLQRSDFSKGITIGLGAFTCGKESIAAGKWNKEGKSNTTNSGRVLIQKTFPASIMQQHTNGFILVDEEAAFLLNEPN